MKILFLACLLVFVTACQQTPVKESPPEKITQVRPSKFSEILALAEQNASYQGKQILITGRKMALNEKTIVKGSCWDYANAIYTRAGFPNKYTKRDIVFKGKKGKLFPKNIDVIQSGDFLYYINHSFHGSEHSAIFIDWVNKKQKIALMLSYAGQNRKKPARYKTYNLSHVYHIIRPRSS